MNALTIFFILFAASYANGFFLLQYLQQSHRQLWTDLGEPNLAQSNLGVPRLQLMKMVWGLRFLKIRDSKLNAICLTAMLLEFGILVSVIWLFVGK